MRTKGFVTAFALLCACAPPPEPPVQPPAPVFRDQAAQIASQVDVTTTRMAGTWFVRQRFAQGARVGRQFEFSALPGGALQLRVPTTFCRGESCSTVDNYLVRLDPTGDGRWVPVDPPIGFPAAEFWVMWMDFDSRTMAIGTPSGTFAWILDKNPTGGGRR